MRVSRGIGVTRSGAAVLAGHGVTDASDLVTAVQSGQLIRIELDTVRLQTGELQSGIQDPPEDIAAHSPTRLTVAMTRIAERSHPIIIPARQDRDCDGVSASPDHDLLGLDQEGAFWATQVGGDPLQAAIRAGGFPALPR